MHFLPAEIKAFTVYRAPLWLGVLLSCSVGLLFYETTANTIERDAQKRFENMAGSVQSTISARIKSYNDVLLGCVSLFQTSTDLTRDQFHRYVDGLSLEKEFPGIESINFARYVTEAELPAFEQRMRKEIAAMNDGLPPFRITPPGRRASYTVITYIEPMPSWGHRIGVDFTGGGELPSLNRSRDTGEVGATGKPLSNLPGPKRTGLAIRLPIYRNGMPVSSVQERRAAYLGSVGIGFTVQKLLLGVLEQMPVRHVRLSLNDIGSRSDTSQKRPAEPVSLLFDSKATVAVPAPSKEIPNPATFVTTLPIEFNMRSWEVTFNINKSDLYTGFDAYVPWLAMLAGFISTMLLYILFQTLSSSRRNAIKLAQNMTKELRASEAELQWSNENLRRLGAHSEKIIEAERKRIAREIHDDLGQNLLALRMEADLLSSRTLNRCPLVHMRARSTISQIDATIKSVRQIINDLRPNVLDLGLNAAVDWQVAEFRRLTGIECYLTETHQDIQVSDYCATALFRILQESLSNILRHAHATRVQVVLRVERDRVWMSVSDNGIGLPSKGHHKPGSFGLVGIEERINILCGTFHIHSESGSGTIIRVAVPIIDAFQTSIPLSFSTKAIEQGIALV